MKKCRWYLIILSHEHNYRQWLFAKQFTCATIEIKIKVPQYWPFARGIQRLIPLTEGKNAEIVSMSWRHHGCILDLRWISTGELHPLPDWRAGNCGMSLQLRRPHSSSHCYWTYTHSTCWSRQLSMYPFLDSHHSVRTRRWLQYPLAMVTLPSCTSPSTCIVYPLSLSAVFLLLYHCFIILQYVRWKDAGNIVQPNISYSVGEVVTLYNLNKQTENKH